MRPFASFKIFILAILCMLNVVVLNAQDFSNKGTDFWVVYSGHIDGLTSRMALYITSTVNTSGTVSVNGQTTNFTVLANQVSVVQLTSSTTPSNADAYLATNNVNQLEVIGINKGIHIQSQNPVVVYSHILNSARSGSTLVLPTKVLGREYVVAAYKSNGSIVPITGNGAEQQKNTQFEIIATEDGTNVEITPTNSDYNKHHLANVTFDTLLNKGDVYQYQSFEDLTGTKIRSVAVSNLSCKKIAVYSGSTWTALGCSSAGSGDNLYQQLFPTSAWGKHYFTSPSINRKYDLFRILVQDPSSTVFVNGVALSKSSLINNSFYEISTSGDNTYRDIYSDNPISVLQYFITMACDGSNIGDPEMIALNPIEQTLNDITVMSARRDLTPPNTNITNHYLNIIYKSSAFSSLKIDGAAPTAKPIAMGSTGYSFIQEDVTNSTNISPSHKIVCDTGFICIAYGYGNVESYGYNAGTNVVDLYQKLTVNNDYATVKLPATCRGTPFKASITLPYQPISLVWDIPKYPNIPPNYAPVYDSTYIVNGKTIYRYTLGQYLTYDSVGTYTIQLTVYNPTTDGCSGEQIIDFDLVVYDPPKVDFKIINSNCLGDSLFLSDNTTVATGDRKLTTYNWKVGNAPFVNAKDYSIKTDTVGTIPIKYFVITDIGCLSDTLSSSFIVDSVPKINFNIQTIKCLGKDIQFMDSTFAGGGTQLVSWVWNYGDSSINDSLTTNASVIHKFDTAKNYNVHLSVATLNGCVAEKIKTISVYPNPNVGFILPEICLKDPFAQFTDTTKIADASNNFKYLWDFGEPGNTQSSNTSIVANPKHRYLIPGTYQVNEKVTSVNGCIADTTLPFTVNGSVPISSFNIIDSTALCSNMPVQLNNTSIVDIGKIGKLVIYWDYANNPLDTTFDDNPTINKIYKHNYANFRFPDKMKYDIALVSYSGDNCFDQKFSTISIVPPPQSFTISSSKDYLCIADSVMFTPSITGGVPPFSYDWLSNSASANFTGNVLNGISKGSVDVSVNVKDAKQCIYPYSNLKTLEVRDIPIALLKALDTNICNQDPILLVGTGSNLHRWILNKNLYATSNSDTLSTASPGLYQLQVNDGFCNSLLSEGVNTIQHIIPVFGFSNTNYICINTPIKITGNTADAKGAHFNWDFGDSTTSILSQPLTHNYSKNGTYQIKMVYTNDICPKYDTSIVGGKIIVVNPLTGSEFTMFMLSDVDTLLTNIKIDSGYTQYQWIPFTYLSNTLIAHPIFRGLKTTDYTLTRTDTSSNCQIADIYHIIVSNDVVVAIPKAFTPNNDGLNDVLKLEYGAGLKTFNYFKLFNRWGKLIFETSDVNGVWDGRYNGRDQESDAYTYLLDYITYKDEHIKKTGSVILLR